MFCGNAEGEVLPPYICYKAERMHIQWCMGGPPDARYNRTESGWFDSRVFEDWYFRTALPELKKKNGTKVLIGDNLSSHISIPVLDSCKENDIKFIALPKNSTHILQPLDVAYFRPMKISWRKILSNWKETEAGTKNNNVPKTEFPSLIKELTESLALNDKKNLKSGFRKSGIFPLNSNEPKQRLCTNQLDTEKLDALQNVFLEQLEKKRKNLTENKVRSKRTKLSIPAGKSISAEEIIKLREAEAEMLEAAKRKKEEEKQKQEEEKKKLLEEAKQKREEEKTKMLEEKKKKKEADLKAKQEEKQRKQAERIRLQEEKKRIQEDIKKRKQMEAKKKPNSRAAKPDFS